RRGRRRGPDRRDWSCLVGRDRRRDRLPELPRGRVIRGVGGAGLAHGPVWGGGGGVRRPTARLHRRAPRAVHPGLGLSARVRPDARSGHDRPARDRGEGAVRAPPVRHVVVRRSDALTPVAAATFEAPSTKDFVFRCWGGSFKIGGATFCLNFITLLVLLT